MGRLGKKFFLVNINNKYNVLITLKAHKLIRKIVRPQ